MPCSALPCPSFPNAAKLFAPLLLVLGVGGLFYAAWIALAQTDIKRLVAYSSISHMGLIVIGIAIWNSITLSGAILQMINHGLSTSALFIMVGMLDERLHSRDFAVLGRPLEQDAGLQRLFPVLCPVLPGPAGPQ